MSAESRPDEFVATTSDGIRISYEDHGRGEPALLLLPGWASSRRAFAQLVSPLAGSHRVLAMDFRGHGRSAREVDDFGLAQLTEDAIAVIEQSGAGTVVPVALSHAGWVALELRQRLGDRIPRMIFLDWIVLDPPAPFLQALTALQASDRWRGVRDQLFGMWLAGTNHDQVSEFLASDMGEYSFDTWSRAGREIERSYRAHGNPLQALAAIQPPVSALHIYAQPDAADYLEAQQAYAAQHPWFQVVKLRAKTHFPMFEVPEAMSEAITAFVAPEP